MKTRKSMTCAIHDLSHKNKTIDKLAIFIARELSFAIIGIPVIYILLFHSPKTDALYVIALVLIAVYIQFEAQRLIKRERPFQKEQLKPLFKVRIQTRSFPSGHATMLGALITALVGLSLSLPAWLIWFVLVGTFLILLSRVYAGLHYISDIIAGLILSVVAVTAVDILITYIATGHIQTSIFGNLFF